MHPYRIGAPLPQPSTSADLHRNSLTVTSAEVEVQGNRRCAIRTNCEPDCGAGFRVDGLGENSGGWVWSKHNY